MSAGNFKGRQLTKHRKKMKRRVHIDRARIHQLLAASRYNPPNEIDDQIKDQEADRPS